MGRGEKIGEQEAEPTAQALKLTFPVLPGPHQKLAEEYGVWNARRGSAIATLILGESGVMGWRIGPQPSTHDDPSQGLAENLEFMTAFALSNAAALAKLYTQGGQLLPPGLNVVAGRAAIQPFWQGTLDMGLALGTLETVEV